LNNTPSPSGSVGDQQSNKAGCPSNRNYQKSECAYIPA